MFNGVVDDLAMKPYIPHKIDFNEFVANVMIFEATEVSPVLLSTQSA